MKGWDMRAQVKQVIENVGFMAGGLLAVAIALSGCAAREKYVEIQRMPDPVVSPQLQACAVHAAGAQKAAFGDNFNGLQLGTRNLVVTAPKLPVGNQNVAEVLDGEGQWYGRTEYRKVRFHCMVSPAGQVVYSFVRGE